MPRKRLSELFSELSEVDKKLSAELFQRRNNFQYIVKERVVRFKADIKETHKRLKTNLITYIFSGSILFLITAPIIYAMIIPTLLLDLFVEVYHNICFPIYGIKKVKRKEYIVIDRHKLSYLNIIEKVHCVYCGYFNGLIAYVGEIASRTEQYWCPIRHAIKHKGNHERFKNFIDYGDAETYKRMLDQKRNALAEEDLK